MALVRVPFKERETSSGGLARTPFSLLPAPSNPNANIDTSRLSADILPSPVSEDEGIGSKLWNAIKSGYHHVEGGLQGIANPFLEKSDTPEPEANPLSAYFDQAKRLAHAVGKVPGSAYEGFMNPEQMDEQYKETMSQYSPIDRFVGGMATDPLTYAPVGTAAKLAAPAVKRAMSVALKVPGVSQATDLTKDALGKVFVRNYGATPELKDIINRSTGESNVNQFNTLKELKSLQKNTPLSNAELQDIGHIMEGTKQAIRPEQADLAAKLQNILRFGPEGSDIGSSALSSTTSAVTGEPLLSSVRLKYFPHQYNQVPDELKGAFPKKAQGTGGLSPQGTYNLPRTFETLESAIQSGLKPEMNPFLVVGKHLGQTSKALINNKMLEQIKNTPGILFDKDPIDEVSKLLKTGRMTADDAASQLGMTVDDLKKGFVQSQIPQLRGAYIRPSDEAALQEMLNPSKTFLEKLLNPITNPWKSIVTSYSPSFHLGNIGGNAFNNALGGVVNPARYAQAVGALKGGADTIEIGGKTYTKDELLQLAHQENALGSGFYHNDVPKQLEDSLNPSLWSKVAGSGRAVGNKIEETSRMAHFIDQLDKGKSPGEAAASVNKHLFDYSDLSTIERGYIKPVVPFYTFLRKNLPLQMENLAKNQQVFTQYMNARNNMSDALDADEENLPDYMNQQLMIPISKTEDGKVKYLNPKLPLTDIMRLFQSPKDMAKDALMMGNPWLTVLPQLTFNQNWLTEQPIESFEGQKKPAPFPLSQIMPEDYVNKQTGEPEARIGAYPSFLFNQLGAIKMLSDTANRLSGDESTKIPVLSTFIKDYDPGKAAYYKRLDDKQKLSDRKRRAKDERGAVKRYLPASYQK